MGASINIHPNKNADDVSLSWRYYWAQKKNLLEYWLKVKLWSNIWLARCRETQVRLHSVGYSTLPVPSRLPVLFRGWTGWKSFIGAMPSRDCWAAEPIRNDVLHPVLLKVRSWLDRVIRTQYSLTSSRFSLVRESTANPWMDFQKSTDVNMDIHDFWMLVFNYSYKRGYPHWYPSTDIHARTFRNGYP